MARKISRGKFAGLTARSVAELMHCEESTAKRYLHKLAGQVGGLEELTLEHIGTLIYQYRDACVWKEIKREALRREYGSLVDFPKRVLAGITGNVPPDKS